MNVLTSIEQQSVGGALSKPQPWPLPEPWPLPCPLPGPLPQPSPRPSPGPELPYPEMSQF